MNSIEIVRAAIETRFKDVQGVVRAKMVGADEDAIDQVVCWTVEKALRLAPRFNPERSAVFTWLCMIAYGQVKRYYRSFGGPKQRVTQMESLDVVLERGGEPAESYEDAIIVALDLKRSGTPWA